MTGSAVRDVSGSLSRDDLARDVFGLRSRVPAGATVALRCRRATRVAAAVAALDGWAREVLLLGHLADVDVPADAVEVTDDAQRVDDAAPIAEGDAVAATRWTLFSSGTTGAPKPIAHTLDTLSLGTRPGRDTYTWGLLYEPSRMAGMQVVLQVLVAGHALVDPLHLPTVGERVAHLADAGIDALSATPTTWRQILQVSASTRLRLRQVTLGGEIADQLVLDALRARFPDARVTHVFAATETGVAFGVSDGRAGFPAAYLVTPPKGVRLAVRDGVLWVHAPSLPDADVDGFVSTGDTVRVDGDRVLFLGRQSGVVNVGGVKVWPEQVEAVLREHPAVHDAVVVPRSNPFSGWILTARVVPSPGTDADADALAAHVRAWCAERLPSAHVPAKVSVVDTLPTSATGKAGRT